MTAACLPRTAAVPRDVDIALCRLDDDADIALGLAARWLSPDETERAARFRHPRPRPLRPRPRLPPPDARPPPRP